MRRTIYLFAATMAALCMAEQTTAQDATAKNRLSTARKLYAAGQWAAAAHEFDKARGDMETGIETTENAAKATNERIEAETFAALSNARSRMPHAGDQLRRILEKYPASWWTGEVKFRAGLFYYDAGEFDKAMTMLAGVDPRRLETGDRDEFNFKRGHLLQTAGMDEDARADFENVRRNGGEYAAHATYHLAYMDYAAGKYTAAKLRLKALTDDPAYRELVPYYLVQIEFMEGNWKYVAENIEQLIPKTAMPRRAELAGMAAQSWFNLGEYDRALGQVENYQKLGGEMNRNDHYTAGYSLYTVGRYDEAATHLAAATGADDEMSQNASYHLADIYLRLGDRQRAMQSFSIAAASGANEQIAEDAMFNYGKLLFETGGGRFNEAMNILSRYVATYPGSERAREASELLMAAYYNSKDYEAAYKAIMNDPQPSNNVKAALQKISYFRAMEQYAAGNMTEAQKWLAVAASNRYNTKYTALTAFWQGEIMYRKGDYEGAITKYEEYIRLSPTTETENRMARYSLGYANFNLERWAAARRWFDDFLGRHTEADPYRADALNREGDIRHAERQYWQAIESYDAAAAVGTPQKYYSAYQRAMMMGLVDRPERKIERLKEIIGAGQGDYVEQATFELGRYYIARENYAEGANTLVGFTGKYPESTLYLQALANLGLAYLNMGERRTSMQYYKMIVERAPYSREAQDAMVGIRGLYVDAGDVDGYFEYARVTGAPTDVGEAQRDSLTFAAAQRIYLAGDAAGAIPALENYVRGDARGQYIPTALGYLSGLYHAAGRWKDAADAYKRHAGLAKDPATKSRALEGYVASVIATRDGRAIKAMADEVAAMPETTARSRSDAAFAKAGVLRTEGYQDQAMEIYRTLAGDVSTAAGAESAYRVIEYLYATGDYRKAEEAVFAMSKAGTTHNYWLGEAFLTLGDIYVREGDSFQARATFQSIVDGYSTQDDGIIAAARERIAALK